jgi:hypothetical protein
LASKLNLFFPADRQRAFPSRLAFAKLKQRWVGTFYPGATAPAEGPTA